MSDEELDPQYIIEARQAWPQGPQCLDYCMDWNLPKCISEYFRRRWRRGRDIWDRRRGQDVWDRTPATAAGAVMLNALQEDTDG